ncbi:MAG: phosphotransferase [Acidobacteria bacterium]|nr:phosphotransferase [Acidobacteriota bacterium]
MLIKDGVISGVLDFGDVNLGDPDYDFMYPFLDFGEAFAIDIARRYGHKDLERLLGKMRYYAIVDQIGTTLVGPALAPEGEVTIAWRRLDRLLSEKH